MQHHWAVGQPAYCFGQMGLELWLPRQHIDFNAFFSETTRPTALVFGMWQWLVVPYINHAPGVKFGHTPGVNSLHRVTIGKDANINISKAIYYYTKWTY